MDLSKRRIIVIAAVLAALFVGTAIRLAWMTLQGPEALIAWRAESREARGTIFDRKGVPLALSVERFHVHLNARRTVTEKGLSNIAAATGIDVERIRPLLAVKKTHSLLRFVETETAERAKRAREDALLVERVWQRTYPQGALLGQTLGFVGVDGDGLLGLERHYQNFLARSHDGTNAAELWLSIDAKVQDACERALARAMEKHKAASGMVIVQDPRSGRIHAMASLPSFDPNEFSKADENLLFTPTVSRPLEPGSIFKVFFLGQLLDRYDMDLDKPYFYSSGQTLLANGESIRDSKAYGWVSVKDIVKHSINAGIIQACKDFRPTELRDFLLGAHLHGQTGIDLPGEHRGILRPVRDWGLRGQATILIGQGVAVTPVQLVSSFSALVNGGEYFAPSLAERLVWRDDRGPQEMRKAPANLGRVIKADTSGKMRRLLTWGTVRGSTGERAGASGYDTGGKTGTSQMVNLQNGGYYSNRFDALFAACFPVEDPRVSVVVILRDPRAGHTGGEAAAPVFAEILPDLVRNLDVPVPRNLETWRTRVLQVARLDEAVSAAKGLPDLRHRSLRDAQAIFFRWVHGPEGEGGDPRLLLEGEGYVKSQDPAPGSRMATNGTLRLVLAPP